MRQAVVAVLSASLVLAQAATRAGAADLDAASRITAAGLLRDAKALSDDAMAGRGPGSEGDRKARAYLIQRLQEIGFAPGGPNGGWEQPFPIVGLTIKHPDTWSFRTATGDQASFRWWDDVIGGSGVQAPHVAIDDAEVVFVGYAIQAPEFQWDDFKGANLKGKILLILNNDPEWDPALFAGPKRLHYGRWDYKFESAARQGAAGAIIIHTDASAGYGWNVVQSSWSGEAFELPGGSAPRVRFKSWMTEKAARTLVRLGGRDLGALIATARSRNFKPVPLGVTTSIAFDVAIQKSQTANVIGILPGADPALRAETMIYTAHHDHLGIGPPDATGDTIYNGALDNASGCAQVLAIAEAFAANKVRPKRSIMALFVGGEEQGLLGSAYFAAHPTVPVSKIAADLNIDGGNILGRTEDVAIIGKGKSTLEDQLEAAAKTQSRYVVDEPEPDKGYYYRSDQLNFARIGVPSLYFKSGQLYFNHPAGWGKEKEADYRKHRYHQPSDAVTDDWNMEGMVEDDVLAYLVGLNVANGAKLPAWYPGDEFEAARKKALAGAPVAPKKAVR
jgi:Zn-dependent M28 family amino/carboxypeptidase